jgi:hypothetical protein
VPKKSRRFLSEQLQLVLDELNGSNEITSDFLQTHIRSINEHARDLMEALPPSDHPKPFLQSVA